MSQLFDEIKKEYSEFQDEVSKKRQQHAEYVKKVIDEDRAFLEACGVKKIFEEIRDSGIVKLKMKKVRKISQLNRFFKKNDTEEKYYEPAQIVDGGMYISLRFDERDDSFSEVRVAADKGELFIAHGYNRVDYTKIDKTKLKEAIVEALKNPLILLDSYYA